MSEFVMKAAPDRDLYVEWSTVIDNWIGMGTRQEMLEHLKDKCRNKSGKLPHDYRPEVILDRCDRTGTSYMYHSWGSLLGSWNVKYLKVGAEHLLLRSDLGRYVDCILTGDTICRNTLLISRD